MNVSNRAAFASLIFSLALAGCGGGSDEADSDAPLNTDYSSLRVATSREGALVTASTDEALLRPLKNGVRMNLDPGPVIAGLTAPPGYSRTTQQVEGVDEADLVKYDGRHIFSMLRQAVPAKPGFTRNVLKIAKTDPATATLEVTSEFTLAGEHTSVPLVYQQNSANGATQFIAAISQNYQGWHTQQPQATALVVMPDRTKVQLLDVRDPYNVSQAWEIEFDGWLRGSRKIGDTLYLVNSYRPRLAGIELPAQTDDIKRRNERRIRDASASELLPKYRINGGAAQAYVAAGDCVIAADLDANEAYTDLLVVTAVDLNTRRVTDSACISTNLNGIYMSRDSLYVGGEAFPGTLASAFTVLHKFSLAQNAVSYRASGVVRGRLGWLNASYYMDEFQGDLRVVSSQRAANGNDVHWLSVLREGANRSLDLRARLPNELHPEPIGKPGEQVHAVRFDSDRAYVVTARATDPLYVIDLSISARPFIAGQLEIPGIATYLQPLETDDERMLLTVGRNTDATGTPVGFKVELFNVTDIAEPVSVGRIALGAPGTTSEVIDNPHALTVHAVLDNGDVQYRIALPIDVYFWIGANPSWAYSGLQMLEVSGNGVQPASLRFHGILRTDESSEVGTPPPYVTPRRGVLHDNAVYAVNGETYVSRPWR